MTDKETPEIGALLERYDQLRDAGKDPIFTAASIGHWVAEHRHLLRSEGNKSGTVEWCCEGVRCKHPGACNADYCRALDPQYSENSSK